MTESITLEERELIDLPQQPGRIIRHVGVRLDNDEAQEFISRDYRVFGDQSGPYLVVRLSSGQEYPIVSPIAPVDVTFRPIRWEVKAVDLSGIICWLEEVR